MNGRIIRAIIGKDLKEVRQNGMAWKPMLIVPLVFSLLLPLGLIYAPSLMGASAASDMLSDPDIQMFLNNLPQTLKTQTADMNSHQTMIVLILGYMLAPLFLIMPVFVAATFGAESFAGEKERRTIEPLLYTPVTERELFVGKLLACMLPALGLTWLSFIVYTLVLNLAGGAVIGYWWFPTEPWWPLMLWVSPAVALMGVTASVLVSARVNTFMEAYQSTGFLVLPVLLLVVGQAAGVVYLGVGMTLLIGTLIWLVDAALLWAALRRFARPALMARV